MLVMKVDEKTTVKIIAVYAPISASDDEEIKRFYDGLEAIVRRKLTFMTILGNFSAKLGAREGSEQCIGNFRLEKKNERGRRFR